MGCALSHISRFRWLILKLPRVEPRCASRKQGSIGAEPLWLSLTGLGKSMLLLRLQGSAGSGLGYRLCVVQCAHICSRFRAAGIQGNPGLREWTLRDDVGFRFASFSCLPSGELLSPLVSTEVRRMAGLSASGLSPCHLKLASACVFVFGTCLALPFVSALVSLYRRRASSFSFMWLLCLFGTDGGAQCPTLGF